MGGRQGQRAPGQPGRQAKPPEESLGDWRLKYYRERNASKALKKELTDNAINRRDLLTAMKSCILEVGLAQQAKKSILQRQLGEGKLEQGPKHPLDLEAVDQAVNLGQFQSQDKIRAVHSLLSHDFFVDKLLEFIDHTPKYVFEPESASSVLAKACADLQRAPSASALSKAYLTRATSAATGLSVRPQTTAKAPPADLPAKRFRLQSGSKHDPAERKIFFQMKV